jgi:hypothetical protein
VQAAAVTVPAARAPGDVHPGRRCRLGLGAVDGLLYNPFGELLMRADSLVAASDARRRRAHPQRLLPAAGRRSRPGGTLRPGAQVGVHGSAQWPRCWSRCDRDRRHRPLEAVGAAQAGGV